MRNSFEGRSVERLDLERFHEEALRVLEDSRIKEEDFIERYGEETINRDKATIERREVGHKASHIEEGTEELKMISDVFEALVVQHGELSDWFGPNAVTKKSSKYDDYENGVDMVVEFTDDNEEKSHLGLAADVTFRQDSTSKFDRIRGLIDKDRLATVKYLEGDEHQFPEVVIGVSQKTIMELAELSAGRKNKALGEHKAQIMILLQMKSQLNAFAQYAESAGKGNLAAVFRDREKLVSGILDTKRDLYKKVFSDLDSDPVHFNIMYAASRFNSKPGMAMAA